MDLIRECGRLSENIFVDERRNMDEIIRSAEIISVGTELLLGDIVNTDASYLARELAAIGIAVYRQSVVGDNAERLTDELAAAFRRTDTVFLTGGLGPTVDDVTREVTSRFFGLELEFSDEVMGDIRRRLESIGKAQISENNRRQAYVPRGAEIMKNNAGTAPGLIIHGIGADGRGKTAFLLPGPPSEFELMVEQSVIPWLVRKASKVIVSRNIYMYGIGESAADELLRDLTDSRNPTVAPYCETGEVRIRVTAMAESEDVAAHECDAMVERIRATGVGKYIYAVRGRVLPGSGSAVAHTLVDEFSRAGKSVGFAESCTGGLCAKLVTDIPGASAVFAGGVVAYTPETKVGVLGVPREVIAAHGVVSEECAMAMAAGLREQIGCDVAVSTTGLAGPGGDGVNPCGRVCFGISSIDGTRSFTVDFGEMRSRDTIRTLAAQKALHEALSELSGE